MRKTVDFFFGIIYNINVLRFLLILCRCGEIGRRDGLKIHWTNPPCRFDSDQRHQINKIRTNSLLQVNSSDCFLYRIG